MLTSKEADGAFASSSSLEEEEVWNNISRRDFEISQPLLYLSRISLIVSLFRAKNEKTRERENTFHFFVFTLLARSLFSLSYV